MTQEKRAADIQKSRFAVGGGEEEGEMRRLSWRNLINGLEAVCIIVNTYRSILGMRACKRVRDNCPANVYKIKW